MQDDALYEKCGHSGCWHFIEDNSGESEGTVASDWYKGEMPDLWLHLDNGDKYHDHVAIPSGERRTLREWEEIHPELFKAFKGGDIGPNSKYFPDGPECEHDMLNPPYWGGDPGERGIALDCILCGAITVIPMDDALDAAKWERTRQPHRRTYEDY